MNRPFGTCPANPATSPAGLPYEVCIKYSPSKTPISKPEQDAMVVLYAVGVPKATLRRRFKLSHCGLEHLLGVARLFTDQEFFLYLNNSTTLIPALLEEYYTRYNELYPTMLNGPGSSALKIITDEPAVVSGLLATPITANATSTQVERELS